MPKQQGMCQDNRPIIFKEQNVDRYQALGMAYPDPKTVCLGDCEGTGYVPVKMTDGNETYRRLWIDAQAKEPTDDGWHFVKCPDCDGTGKHS